MNKNSKIVLGAAQFGQKYGILNRFERPDENEVNKIIKFARANGVCTLDTAMDYGVSEQVLGKIGISDFSLITKLSPLPGSNIDVDTWLDAKINQSFKYLDINTLCGLLVHRTNDLIQDRSKRLIKSLKRIKNEGHVKKIGISAYSPAEVVKIWKIFKFDLLQIPLNIFDRRFEESGILNELHNEGVEIHARSIFLQGLLLLKKDELPAKFRTWVGHWDKYHTFLLQENFEPLRLCLSYPLSLPELDKIVIGVDSVSHLKDIVKIIQSDFKFVNISQLKSDDEELIDASLWVNN